LNCQSGGKAVAVIGLAFIAVLVLDFFELVLPLHGVILFYAIMFALSLFQLYILNSPVWLRDSIVRSPDMFGAFGQLLLEY
jgi:hypothetical protein